jgi:8-oxo-dGTP diphosphatase
MCALVDAAFRLAYRVGFPVMLAWWLLRRPAHRGAVVAVWHEDEVLVLRQSYRRGLDFPGGGLSEGETARACACRELAEEVGIVVPEEALRLEREMTLLLDWRYDHVSVFSLRLGDRPALRGDRREVVGACFMPPAAALAAKLSPLVRAYLDAVPMR